MVRACLSVFVKPPRPGEVKTRLGRELGDDGAAALARAFFQDTWATANGRPWADVVLATTDTSDSAWSHVAAERVWSQGPGTLGERLERVLRRALQSYPAAIVIGTDLPGLPPARLDAAHVVLQTSQAVLGPTGDGGFYLIGLRRCPTGLLTGLPWSADDTYACTRRRLRARGLTTTTIAPWFDVDRPSDLERLRQLVRHHRIACPHTTRVLHELGQLGASVGGA